MTELDAAGHAARLTDWQREFILSLSDKTSFKFSDHAKVDFSYQEVVDFVTVFESLNLAYIVDARNENDEDGKGVILNENGVQVRLFVEALKTDAISRDASNKYRYIQLFSQMKAVKEQVDFWRDSFPKADVTLELQTDFVRIYEPFVDTLDRLENGKLRWDMPVVSEILTLADEVRAAILHHMSLIAFQEQCIASRDNEPVGSWREKLRSLLPGRI